MTLRADIHHPRSQEDLVSNLGACSQFARGCHLWGRDRPLPSGSGCRLPASLPSGEDGPVHSRLALLWYSLSPLFCEQAQQCLRLELFEAKILSVSFLSDPARAPLWLSHGLGCYLTLAPSDCPQGIQAPSQCSPCLPVQPPFAGA